MVEEIVDWFQKFGLWTDYVQSICLTVTGVLATEVEFWMPLEIHVGTNVGLNE